MRARFSLLVASATFALSGCAGFWDEVTSREFSLSNTLNPPDPMTVLKTSTDGDARAKAYGRLEEPKKRTGSAAEQDEVIKILSQAAVSDPQPLCRMAAVRTLGRFDDPRAVSALIAAYQSSDQLTPEPAAMVKCQALNALGETRKPDAANFLAEIAKTPLKPDLNDRERGQARDVRLAAVRSLKNFPQDGSATSAAQMLAVGDKDIAVRDRAREAYVAMTGKEPEMKPVPGTSTETNAIATVGHTQPKR